MSVLDIPGPTDEGDDDQPVDAELVDQLGPSHLGTVVSDDRSPSFEELRFRLMPDQTVVPGQFVAILAGSDALVVARVLDLHEVNPHEDALSSTIRGVLPLSGEYAHEGKSTVIYRVARAEPVEEVALSPAGICGRSHEVRTLPLAGSPVLAAGADVVAAALGFGSDPQLGLAIGTLHSDATIPIVLGPTAAQRHILIVGGIGSGKSHTRGVLGEELHAFGVPQVNIDVNGEMVDAAIELGGTNLRPGGGFTIPLSALTREDVLEAIAGVQRGTNIETLIGYSFDALQRDVREGTRATFDVDDLVARIEDEAPHLNMQAANTLRPAQQRTRQLERLAYIGVAFDWVGALQPGAFINIDCRNLLLGDLRILSAAVARDLQNLARSRRIPFTVLSIDEFHLVAPNDDRNVSTQVLREIARIGRHYRLGVLLTTQSPADVDRAILKRLLTRFIHTIEPDQLDSLRGVFSDAAPEVIRSLSKLPQGTCVLTGVTETVRHATVIDIRARVTTHGGATPDVYADLRERGWTEKRPVGPPAATDDDGKEDDA